MWGSVQTQGSLESQTGWPQAPFNKKLVTTPFSARNSSMEVKPASQGLSLEFGFQPNGQTKKILLKKPAEPASLNQDFVISTINLGDSPSYGSPTDDLFPDLEAFGGGSNSDDVNAEDVPNPAEDISDLWVFNDSRASEAAAMMSTKTSSNPMLLVDPKEVEGISCEISQKVESRGSEMTQDVTNSRNEGVHLSYVEPVTANDEVTYVLENSFDLSPMDFDLINSVLDGGILVEDPAFQSLVGNLDDVGMAAVNSINKPEDLWSNVDSEVSDQDMAAPAPPVFVIDQPLPVVEPVQEAKRGRGRPRLVRPLIPAAPKRRGRPPSTATFVPPALSTEDPEEARYRRMRDLNNEASRRCRLNRKRKFETNDHELQYEQDRNAELQMKVRLLTEQISKLKDAHIKLIVQKRA